MQRQALKAAKPLKLYNTETRKKEVFTPIEEGHVKLYTCGPTVYNFAHIGNFRTYIFEDLLRRTLQFFGFKVTQVMNITDVDDKTIRGALQSQVSLEEYIKPYVAAFFDDLKTLNIQPAEKYPSAIDHIPDMIEMIAKLIEKGIAYQGSDGSVYYSIGQFPRYGCLSHLNIEELQVGASQRVASDEYDKDHVSDFVLWKRHDAERDGDIYWKSPWGPGRPGWHMECSAMALKHLGNPIDIHCGGVDNIFPHHENEIAQSEAYCEDTFVHLWLHSEHLIVEGKKMSKSLGNFYTLRDLLEEGFSGRQVRYLLLQTHYKTQLNFTHEGINAAHHALTRLDEFVFRLLEVDTPGELNPAVEALCDRSVMRFAEALADDLNISVALAALFDLVREGNALCDQGKVYGSSASYIIDALRSLDTVLGFLIFEKPEASAPPELIAALEQRDEARQQRNWPEADRLRDLIHAAGYQIEDGPSGSRLRKK